MVANCNAATFGRGVAVLLHRRGALMESDRTSGLRGAGGEMEIGERAACYNDTEDGQHQTSFEWLEQGPQADSFQGMRRGLSRDFLQ
jgi:hypothetical protein